MNPTILSNPWLHLFGILAFESAIIVGLAAALQMLLQAPSWRRTIWQTCVIALLAVVIVECFGGAHWLTKAASLKPSRSQIVATKNPNASVAPPIKPQLNPEFRNLVAERMATTQRPKPSASFPLPASTETISVPLEMPAVSATGPLASEIASETTKLNGPMSFEWFGLIWTFGVAVLAARGFLGRCAFAVIRLRRQSVCDAELEHRVQALARGIGLTRRVRVIQLRGLSGLIAFGLARPTVALPPDFAARFNATQQSAMLVHELVHLAAHDPAWNLAADLAVAAWWWNPLAWWARREFRAACEAAADEASLVVRGGPSALAECLVDLGARLTQPRTFGWLGVGGSGFRSGLGRRVERLINLREHAWHPVGRTRSLLAQSIGPAALVAIAVCGAAWTSPQSVHEGERARKLMQRSWQRPFAVFAMAGAAAETPSKSPEPASKDVPKATASPTPEPAPAAMMRRYGMRPPAGTTSPGIDPVLAQRYGLATTSATNLTLAPNLGQRIILKKLESIYFDELPKFDGVPLSEVVKFLRDEAVKRDPTQKGINFIVNSMAQDGSNSLRTMVDPNTGETVSIPRREPRDLNKVLIRLTFPLRSIRFKDALDVLTEVADSPIGYTIEEYAVVFTQGTSPQAAAAAKAEVAAREQMLWRYGMKKSSGSAAAANDAVPPPPPGIVWDEALAKRYGLVMLSGTNTVVGPTSSTKGRLTLYSKLDQIVIEQTPPFDLPLSEVVRYLHDEARKRDAEKRGINFVIAAIHDPADATAVNPFSGEPLPANPTNNLNDVRVKLSELRNVRLKEVLDAVIKVAERPLQYSVENYGVVVFAAADKAATTQTKPQAAVAAPAKELFTRTFRVNPDTVTTGLERAFGISLKGASKDSPTTNQVQTALRELLSQLGLDMTSGGNALFYNDRAGILMVRASLADLETVEKAMEVLNANPPQVVIEAKLVTLSDADAKALGMDWFLGKALIDQTTNGTAGASQPNFRTNAALTTANGILTDPQFRVVLRALEQHGGVDVLGAPRVTTLSGRQAQVSMTERKSIVTGIEGEADDKKSEDDKTKSTKKKFTATPMDFGPTLDVVPYVAADDYTIRVKVVCHVKEFVGYDEPPKSSNAQDVEPLPRIRVSEVESHSVLLDGQTLVLGGGLISENVLTKDKVPVLGDIPLLGRLFRSETALTNKKHLVVFLTPRIIDPAGNPVHSADNFPVAPNSVASPPKVFLSGQIKNTRAISLPDNGSWTISNALVAAGGTTEFADLNKIQLTRNGKKTIHALDKSFQPLNPDEAMKLEPGDFIFVPAKTINF
ncbi:MAG: hypothetical protein HY043_22310 [Verrucomicrobia bacterium]|nr:hypothetical protein [Verrucomicrobiota bacterium]